MPKLETSAGN